MEVFSPLEVLMIWYSDEADCGKCQGLGDSPLKNLSRTEFDSTRP
jgi:hypothetical protein